MGIVILLSVLSTLGIVAVVTSVVVMFLKLKGKVGKDTFFTEVKSFHDYINHIERERINSISELNNHVERLYKELSTNLNDYGDESHRRLMETERSLQNELSLLQRNLDSRCDKLDSKIKEKKQ
jgi:predicted HicB family RNase H-like nuclease